ncbi:hypothetical protein [Clavibacter sp. VKM Ac-2872]|uniref:hypothetical protein n=1 Tax=Clavibacter sp. VKM Ac-2872 TaxID=2783812 RepID=UPI00188D1F2C|nr:hypothetical protein [Clavibacter sp. VKM Ac-2872]MBF4625532.1 hypothetical protein [Clavibacter sp. VKM Ac-2872]
MCASHYMRKWRYGDPLHTPPRPYRDLTGLRFGDLIVTSRVDSDSWSAACTCGATTTARTGDLNRGAALTCGDRRAHRRTATTYHAVHDRLTVDRGRAAEHDCADCGGPAAQWSYDHADPDELAAEDIKGRPLYSLDPDHYQPRCVPCHKVLDLHHAAIR